VISKRLEKEKRRGFHEWVGRRKVSREKEKGTGGKKEEIPIHKKGGPNNRNKAQESTSKKVRARNQGRRNMLVHCPRKKRGRDS